MIIMGDVIYTNTATINPTKAIASGVIGPAFNMPYAVGDRVICDVLGLDSVCTVMTHNSDKTVTVQDEMSSRLLRVTSVTSIACRNIDFADMARAAGRPMRTGYGNSATHRSKVKAEKDAVKKRKEEKKLADLAALCVAQGIDVAALLGDIRT